MKEKSQVWEKPENFKKIRNSSLNKNVRNYYEEPVINNNDFNNDNNERAKP